MLFDEEFIEQARATRASPVAKAVRSTHAKTKDASKRADDGLPLHSFTTTARPRYTRLQHHPHPPQSQCQDRHHDSPHTAAGQGLQTARCEPRLFPVTHRLPAINLPQSTPYLGSAFKVRPSCEVSCPPRSIGVGPAAAHLARELLRGMRDDGAELPNPLVRQTRGRPRERNRAERLRVLVIDRSRPRSVCRARAPRRRRNSRGGG